MTHALIQVGGTCSRNNKTTWLHWSSKVPPKIIQWQEDCSPLWHYDMRHSAEMVSLNSNGLYWRVHFTAYRDNCCWVTLTICHMTAWFKRGATLRIKPTSLITDFGAWDQKRLCKGWRRPRRRTTSTQDDSRRVNLWTLGSYSNMSQARGSTEVKSWEHRLSTAECL